MFQPDAFLYALFSVCILLAVLFTEADNGTSYSYFHSLLLKEMERYTLMGEINYVGTKIHLSYEKVMHLCCLYLHPRTYRRIAPDFQEECPRCGLESCSLTHMLWQWPRECRGGFMWLGLVAVEFTRTGPGSATAGCPEGPGHRGGSSSSGADGTAAVAHSRL